MSRYLFSNGPVSDGTRRTVQDGPRPADVAGVGRLDARGRAGARMGPART